MNYTLHQLQVFLKVAQTQSVTRAAEELFLSQPGVSIQLRNLQSQFAQPLTEVVGRKIYITDFGKEVAVLAERIFEEVGQLNGLAAAHPGDLLGKLKLAVVSTGNYLMPYFLADFLKTHPRVTLQMDVTNRSKVLKSLEKNEVDFALVSILPSAIKVDTIPLIENRLFLVGPADGSVYPEPLPTTALEGMTLIYREAGSGTRVTMEQFITKQHLRVHKKISLSSNEAVKQAVIAGLGYSIMPLIGIHTALIHNELAIVPMAGLPLVSAWNLISLKDKQFSSVAQAYLEFLHAQKAAILQQHFSWIHSHG